MVSLLPYIEQEGLYRQFDVEKGYAGNAEPARSRIALYRCPLSRQTDEQSAYVALAGLGLDAASRPAGAAGIGFMGYDRVTTFDSFKDGTANTIALMETRASLGPWARGGSSTLRGFDPTEGPPVGDGRPFGGHPSIAVAALADGSVRVFAKSTDPHKLAAWVTIAGSEPLTDWE